MPAVVVVGGQWGDEGKGRIVDLLSRNAAVVARFNGGDNAGHTIINELGEFALHLVPAGIFYPQTRCVIGNGVVVNPRVLLGELDLLAARGVDISRVAVSDRAHLIMPYHLELERLEEEARGAAAIGTTRRGIGPCYADKAARLGIRMGDLLDPEGFTSRLKFVLEYKNRILERVYGARPLDWQAIADEYLRYGERLRPFIRDTSLIVSHALEQGDLVLLEGAQGTLLDLDYGTYPYVTSSSTGAGGACLGVGIGPTQITHTLGVFKAYVTRVGSGPMPTELTGEVGQLLRERAREYGATTGRPRRCGWFDAVLARFSARVNDLTSIAITRLDILDAFDRIKVCVAYQTDGVVSEEFPTSAARLAAARPVYEELPGWLTDTSGVRRFEDLPPNAQRYVRRLEELIGRPVSLVSVGPERNQVIPLRPIP
jgi:adenylosuccinate synthase